MRIRFFEPQISNLVGRVYGLREQTREYFGFLCACRGNFVIASVFTQVVDATLEKKSQTRFDNLLVIEFTTQRPHGI